MDEQLRGLIAKEYKSAGYSQLGSMFGTMASGAVNYSALRTDAYSLGVQANEIELQATQRANQMREQFNTAVGNYMFSAARRGVAVTSGNVQSNIQGSAENLGKDIQTMQKNASLKAGLLRSQAKQLKADAKYGLAQTGFNMLMQGASAYSSFSTASSLGSQNATGTGGGSK